MRRGSSESSKPRGFANGITSCLLANARVSGYRAGTVMEQYDDLYTDIFSLSLHLSNVFDYIITRFSRYHNVIFYKPVNSSYSIGYISHEIHRRQNQIQVTYLRWRHRGNTCWRDVITGSDVGSTCYMYMTDVSMVSLIAINTTLNELSKPMSIHMGARGNWSVIDWPKTGKRRRARECYSRQKQAQRDIL